MSEVKFAIHSSLQIDEMISRLPLFLPFSQTSLLELREQEKPDANCWSDDPISDYWDKRFTDKIRFIHLPTLIQWLRAEKVPDETLKKN